MIKKILLMGSLFFTGVMGFASAQNVTLATNGHISEPLAQPNHATRLVGSWQASSHQVTAYPRFELKDRIRSQRERISQDLKDHTITADNARVCLAVLKVVDRWVNREAALNGSKLMTEKKYEAGNKTLDMNSKMIHELPQV
jgi:hypothetical protein